jgi:hypothetical protein
VTFSAGPAISRSSWNSTAVDQQRVDAVLAGTNPGPAALYSRRAQAVEFSAISRTT